MQCSVRPRPHVYWEYLSPMVIEVTSFCRRATPTLCSPNIVSNALYIYIYIYIYIWRNINQSRESGYVTRLTDDASSATLRPITSSTRIRLPNANWPRTECTRRAAIQRVLALYIIRLQCRRYSDATEATCMSSAKWRGEEGDQRSNLIWRLVWLV